MSPEIERSVRDSLARANRRIDEVHAAVSLLNHRQQPRRPGASLVARLAMVTVRAVTERGDPAAIAAQLFPRDVSLGRVIERAASGPAMSQQPGWAQELTAETVTDVLTNIMPTSVLAQLRQRSGMELQFVGGSIARMPQHTPQANGAFVGEGAPIPVVKLLLGSLTLPIRKCASISAFTRELAAGSPLNVEAAFRVLLQQDLGIAVDQVLLGSGAATTIQPPGLLNGLSSLTPASTGTTTDKIAADVRTLFAAITPAAVPTLVVSTVEAGALDVVAPGLNKITSMSVPSGQVIAVDAAAFVSAMGGVEFLTSEDPLIHMEDTTPLPLVGGTAQPPALSAIAAPQRSMWQTAGISLRTLLETNWALRRANAVAFMTGVSW